MWFCCVVSLLCSVSVQFTCAVKCFVVGHCVIAFIVQCVCVQCMQCVFVIVVCSVFVQCV